MVTEAGSGEEFLRFHRVMIRNFKWLIANTPGVTYTYTPWANLPDFLKARLDAYSANYSANALSGITQRIQNGTADELGGFIEPNLITLMGPPAGVHNTVHGLLSSIEHLAAGSNADMGSLAQAPFNDYFWNLHGWIDGFFGQWQVKNGEQVDLSPLDPNAEMGHMHMMGLNHGHMNKPISMQLEERLREITLRIGP